MSYRGILSTAILVGLLAACLGGQTLPAPEATWTALPPAAVTDSQLESPAGQESPPEAVFAVAGIKAGQSLEIHQGPAAEAEIIGQIPATATNLSPASGVLGGDAQGWIQVDYQGISGWVDRSHLAEQHGMVPEELIELGLIVLERLQSYQYQDLEELIDPDLCLRFSPYSYLHPDGLSFCAADLEAAPQSSQVYQWGWYDGTGDPINLTFREYHDRFVYDTNFFQAPVIGFNTEVSAGNVINNISEVYPDGMMIEYYFPGFDPQYGGMDWRSLRLVFIQEGNTWYLAAIIHGEWTI